MYKQIVGVYQIQSLIKPFRVYVGSGVNIHQRWSQHLQDLRVNKHHSHKLQRHYNKYGESDLVFDIIESGEYVGKNHLLSREQGWFARFEYKNTEMPYFNETPIAGSPLGIKRSKEFCENISKMHTGNQYVKGMHFIHTKESEKKRSDTMIAFYQTDKGKLRCKRHSEIMKGRPKPIGFGEKISIATSGEKHHQFGKPLKKETKEKMSLVRKGRRGRKGYKQSSETIAKLTEKRKRENLSEETLIKMRNSQLGKKHSEETKEKISKGNKGRIVSEETRKKISEARTGDRNPNFGKKQEREFIKRRIAAMMRGRIKKKISIIIMGLLNKVA